jgi:hypothetical protein
LRKLLLSIIVLAGIPAWSAVIYQNTTTDTLFSVFYSAGPYEEIGDRVTTTGADSVRTATVQFFNLGAAGQFDATLRILDLASNQLGSATLSALTATSGSIFDVTFDFGTDLLIPSEVDIFVSIFNVGDDVDLGVNLFDPPTVGSSDSAFYLTDIGQIPANPGEGNLYLQLDTPEPSTLFLMAAGIPALLLIRKRREQQR